MNYEQWATEYLTEAEQLKGYVQALRAERRYASCNEINELNKRIAMLYRMYLECRDVGQTLREHAQRRGECADAT